ncbi:MAG: hypothetical protein KF866_01760 [Phycisphaeraceae bacterium]|nr:hypothetical protein [Phycisphaeraceae bacterium]MCW5753581.1 hypothetical protein [Phycisphaeraceae bacterium]
MVKTLKKRFGAAAAAALVGVCGMTGTSMAGATAEQPSGSLRVLQLPIRTDGPKTLDPVRGSTTYDNMAAAQLYETLLENSYANPMKYEPRLLAELPTRSEDGLTYRFRLKDGVRFHDNRCFPNGRGREIRTDDVFYSLKRMGDSRFDGKNWWLVENTILGFDDYKAAQEAAGTYDYDAPVEGFVKINDKEFEIRLTKPVTRFLWVLTMFQTSIVPREAVEFYKEDFIRNPVGTGPFMLRSPNDWVSKQSLRLERNPNYHEVLYPARDQWSREDQRMRMHQAAGRRVPFVDRLEFTMFVEDQPMWLEFEVGNLAYTEVPAEYFDRAFDKRTRQLLPALGERGVRGHSDLLLDFIFRGFNMEDELVGGYTPQKKALRQAINLAINLDEFNELFYNGLNHVYDGPIPPGLEGYPEGGRAPVNYRGPNLELARQKLAEAGYPNGQGLPPIKFYTSRGGNNPQQTELLRNQLRQINVRVEAELVDFSTLIEYVNNRKAPMFGFAWSSDYPDAENNLALFYSPNQSPGSNHYNYSRPEYDAMYEKIITMPDSPERTAIYERMRDMLIDDAPFIGSMARTRFYLIAPWALNLRPTERYWAWFKYVDVDDARRPRR